MRPTSIYSTLLLFIFAPVARSQGTDGQASTAQCAPYPGGVCSGYIDYDVYLPDGATFELIEAELAPLNNLTEWLGDIYYPCVEAYHQYSCPLSYPKCGTTVRNDTQITTVQTGCQSACEHARDACSVFFDITGNIGALPDCNAISPLTNLPPQPDSNCNAVPAKDPQKVSQGYNVSAVPEGYVLSDCTPPFIKDPLAKAGTTDTIDPVYCRFGCCIPCPAQNYFYNEGYTEKGFLATDILRITAAVLSLFIFVSYLILPDKRRHPTIIILFVSACIFVFSSVAFFSIGNPKRLQCAPDGIRQGAQDNNILCAVQGALLIFSSMGSTMWCSVMIFNLHLHTVWNNNFLRDKYIILNIICWGIPAAIMSVCLGLHLVKFEFANLCLVEVEYIMKAFFYPLAAIALPSFVAHFGTFVYIGRVSMRMGVEADMSQSLSNSAGGNSTTASQQTKPRIRRHRHVVAAVKIQWRALLLATVMVVAVVFYWLFYMIQISKMMELKHNPKAIFDWIGCMMTPGNHQNDCTYHLEGYLPPYALMITAETLVSIIGISLFFNFTKRSLLREWNDWIYDVRLSFGKRGRVEKNGDQFFAL
ncbi:hypothetical protein BDB00DRAFT_985562 [Zychaea mexicana]|uniref:uncharacterized protein n=1 Tax=Zychaea mexicana TaxID=64656 RepID=UPI0022FECBF8|nr:uncharacterized protein BDB00DRAFT_985562 [Zychaea mexicana]KAI9467855.1 hypothetical protein BDB00DRAFT_985562 [Zychaea mexicana]